MGAIAQGWLHYAKFCPVADRLQIGLLGVQP
jgi:hypothetical protein